MSITKHAERRMQQRAIPPVVIDLLEQFGSQQRCGGGCRVFFDKSAKRRMAAHMGGPRGLKTFEPWLGVYVVLSDVGTVVTAAHRTKRIHRDFRKGKQ